MHRDPQTLELWTQLPYGLRHVDKSRCAAKVLSCLHFHFSVLHSMHPPADVWTVVMWSTLQIRILGSHKTYEGYYPALQSSTQHHLK